MYQAAVRERQGAAGSGDDTNGDGASEGPGSMMAMKFK